MGAQAKCLNTQSRNPNKLIKVSVAPKVTMRARTRRLLRTLNFLTFFTAILAVATIVLSIATIGLWNYAAEQASDMKESIGEARRAAAASETAAKVARETLEASQRPFVFVQSFEGNVLGNIIRFAAKFENSGISPTRNMRSRLNWKWFPGEPPDDFDYPDLDKSGNIDSAAEIRPTFVGPKSVAGSFL